MMEGIWRRLRNVVRLGSLTASSDAGVVLQVQAKLSYLEIFDGRPAMQHFGFASNPPPGSDAVLLCPEGNPSKAIVVATNHQPTRVTGQNPGETSLYNAFSMRISLSENGIIVDGGGKPLIIQNAPTITADAALLRVKGDILDNYETNTRTQAQFRTQIYDPHTHPVPGGTSGPPTPQA